MNIIYLGNKAPCVKEKIQCEVVSIPQDVTSTEPEDKRVLALFRGYMKIRNRVFSEEKKWDVWLPGNNDLDPYDQHDTKYVIAYMGDGEVIGGFRLLPTDRSEGVLTCMIRDAHKGTIKGLPTDLCEGDFEASSDVWEVTRFVTNGDPLVSTRLMSFGRKYLREAGATSFVFIGSPAFAVLAKRQGHQLVPMGPRTGNHDGRFQAFKCPL